MEWFQAIQKQYLLQVVSGTGLQVEVELYDNGAKKWKIINKGSGYKEGDKVTIPFDLFSR